MEQVARKVEALRVEQPRLKVVRWEAMVSLMCEEVNGLLTERQLSYIFKCLANAGVVCVHLSVCGTRMYIRENMR